MDCQRWRTLSETYCEWQGGKRTAIARHSTETYLRRIQERTTNIAQLTFDAFLKKRLNQKVFALEDGTETNSLTGIFRILMRDSGLDKDRDALCTLEQIE